MSVSHPIFIFMKESKFQKDLKDEIEKRFPNAIVLKNDSSCIQGIPDLLILYKDKWAALEVKKSKNASRRPNQEYYVELMNKMSHAAVVYPENREEVLRELESTFTRRSGRKSRVPRSQ